MKNNRKFLLKLFWVILILYFSNTVYSQKIIKEGKTFITKVFKPAKLIVDNNRIYILDKGDMKLKVFDRKGKLLGSIGKKGQAPGEFVCPSDFSLYSEQIYILDSCGRKIEVFNKRNFQHIKSKRINVLQPISLSITQEKAYVGRVCTSPNEKVIEVLSLKNFRVIDKRLTCVLNGPMSIQDIYKNAGILRAVKKDVYFVYYLYNKLLKININKRAKTYKIPFSSITNPEIILKGGSTLLKEGLNYDLKERNGKIWVLSRNQGVSYLLELHNEKLEIKYKINRKIISFDFLSKKHLLIIDEDFNVLKVKL